MNLLLSIIFLGLLIYLLWSKVNKLEEKTGEASVTKLRLTPKGELYDLPIMKELAHLDSSDFKVAYKDLSKESRDKLKVMLQGIGDKLYLSFLIFNDKNLIYVNNLNSGKNPRFRGLYDDYLYFETLGEIKEGKTVQFIIESRVEKDSIPNVPVPVLTGYLRKYDEFSIESENKNEIEILFNIPRFLITPLPAWSTINILLGKTAEKVLAEKGALLKRFGFETKSGRDYWSVGGYTDDFGERKRSLGRETWYENKYFEVEI